MSLHDLKSRHHKLTCASQLAQARGDIKEAFIHARQAVQVWKEIQHLTLPSAVLMLAMLRTIDLHKALSGTP